YFSVNGNTGTLEQHISSASYETSVLLGEGSLFVTGTNPLFSGIDFVIDNSANWGLHSAVDKSYVDSKVFTGAIMPTTLTAASFGGNSYQTITTTKKVAYIINANTHVITSPTYDNAANPTQVTIDIGVVPTGNVIIGFVQ
ncbi:MAG: hypothetical protein JWQ09_937, partial [Segetibacter sp.]|nr:hypothetical protein [Segetibacter sp.]